MYGTQHIQGVLSKEHVLARVSEEHIFTALGIPTETIGSRFCSPFRPDKSPDCKLYTRSDGKLCFYDPADNLRLDALDTVRYAHNLSFQAALRWIVDHCLGEETDLLSVPPLQERPRILPSKAQIKVRERALDNLDYAWWAERGVTKEYVQLGSIHAVTDYWVNGNYTRVSGGVCYCYLEEDGLKLYFPFAQDRKRRFLGNTKAISCWELLPQTGPLVIITSSKKDALCLWSLGYPAIAPQGEGMDLPPDKLWELKQRFQRQVIFYDNDHVGLKLAFDKCQKWEVSDYTFLPFDEAAKDPSDYYHLYGHAKLAALLPTLLT